MTDTYNVSFDWVDEQGESQHTEIEVEAEGIDDAEDKAWDRDEAPDHGTASVREN